MNENESRQTNKQTKIVSRKKERNGRKFLPFVKAQWPCRIFHPKKNQETKFALLSYSKDGRNKPSFYLEALSG